MKPTLFRTAVANLTAVAVIGTAGLARSGEVFLNFDTDPAAEGLVTLFGSSFWYETGGNPNTGGYLSVTDALNGQRGAIIFDDLEGGLPVNAFRIEVDLRVGGGTTSPADGFSFNFVRPDDPVLIDGEGWAASPTNEANLPEEGSTTGIGVGFDEWFSGGADVIGISVRVDGELLQQVAFPTLNGDVGDTTSLQTGPANEILDFDNDLPNHGWAPLVVELNESSNLLVTYKGVEVVNEVVPYFPSPGQVALAGRTGDSNSHHHMDNLRVVTTAATLPVLTALSGDASGFAATLQDSPISEVDISKPYSVTLDGSEVPAAVEKDGQLTTFTYSTVLPELLAPGQYPLAISALDTNDNPVNVSNTVTVDPYTTLPPEWRAADGVVDTGMTGFNAHITQIAQARGPGDVNSYANAERQFNWQYVDPATGEPYPNTVDPTTSGPDGVLVYDNFINLSQDIGDIGNLPFDDPIPGIPGTPDGPADGTDNIVGTFTAWLDLPAGAHELIVNSDDGFDVSFGENPNDILSRVSAGRFDGGRGAADTVFNIAVPEGGLFPVRLIWWEGGGGANVEFIIVDPATGDKIPVNDPSNPASPAAYYSASSTPTYVGFTSPLPDATGADPGAPIVVRLHDGIGATVDAGSVAMTLDGAALTVTTEVDNGLTIATGALPGGLLAPLSVHEVGLTYSESGGAMRSETWSFTVADYTELAASNAFPPGSGVLPGHTAAIYQIDPFDEGFSNGSENWNEVTEAILAGIVGPNYVETDQAVNDYPYDAANGYFVLNEFINWDEAGAGVGNFTLDDFIPGIPGTTFSTDNITAEILTHIEFPAAGFYTLGVNSDDNFRMMEGQGPGTLPLTINSPAGLAGGMLAVAAMPSTGGIGTPLPVPGITADVVYADPPLADAPLNNAAAINGNIALIDRGTNPFSEKVLAAQAAGAVAVLVANNADTFPINMGGDPAGITIPALMVSQADGIALAAGGANATITGELANVLGEFQGGRGSADTLFNIWVPQAGLYPIRTTWKEGGGGANIEIFSQNANGTRYLINDSLEPNSLRAFYQVEGGGGGDPDFRIVSVEHDQGTNVLTVTFTSSPGSNYRSDWSATMADGSWVELVDNITASAGTTTVTAAAPPTAGGVAFVRIVQLP